MLIKIFILGRPGSGKSSAARRIVKLSRKKGLRVTRINDYEILKAFFQSDGDRKYFRPTKKYKGFDVTNFSILDSALRQAAFEAKKAVKSSNVVVIEFARDNYREALQHFDPIFLRDAYFLFINTDVDTCIERICHRVAFPTTSDDHFVSAKILREYYREQIVPFGSQIEVNIINIDQSRVKVVDNRGERHQFDVKIRNFFNWTIDNDMKFRASHRFGKRYYAPLRNVLTALSKTLLTGIGSQKI